MSSFKFNLDAKGVRELLKSEEMSNICKEYADGIYNSANGVSGYAIEKRNYPERVGWAVYASEYPAISDNLNNNSLLKAVGR